MRENSQKLIRLLLESQLREMRRCETAVQLRQQKKQFKWQADAAAAALLEFEELLPLAGLKGDVLDTIAEALQSETERCAAQVVKELEPNSSNSQKLVRLCTATVRVTRAMRGQA